MTSSDGPPPIEPNADDAPEGEYELPLGDGSAKAAIPKSLSHTMPLPILVVNAKWFCRLRWLVVLAFAVFWAVGLFPDLLMGVGLRPGAHWPIVVALILSVGNVGFIAHLRSRAADQVKANLWLQIAFDLLILTGVVHLAGSLSTFAPFAYVLHIALACIFFSRAQSFGVTVMACVLFMGCIGAERAGLLQPTDVFASDAVREAIHTTPVVLTVNMATAVAVFATVWYLVSKLSVMVRERDHRLAQTNRQLAAAHEERTRHMLETTHQLKAPFAAVHANAQLLTNGYCGPLSDVALTVVTRISERCQRLANEIQQMLQLANLRTTAGRRPDDVEIDLAEIINWAISRVAEVAQANRITIEADVEPTLIWSVEDHMKMLLSNLIDNAVNYSRQGGHVRVVCRQTGNNEALVSVEDKGIGILPDKLPRVFDEYYRTDEAVSHNRESTGLGLAIVSHVARTHGIRVQVASKPGHGTRFTLHFSPELPGVDPE